MFRKKVEWKGKSYNSLSDILKKRLDIVFVGLSPSISSVESGHYHSDPLGKRFWNTLIGGEVFIPKAGVHHDEIILSQKMGLTDIVKRPTRGLKYIQKEDFEEGRKLLFQKIIDYKPRILCSVYKTAFEELFETRFTNLYGFLENYRIGKTPIFIMSSPFLPRDAREENILELKELRDRLRKQKR